MASIAFKVSKTNQANASSETTGSFTMLLGSLMLVFVTTTGLTTPGTLTNSDGTTFVLAQSTTKNAGADAIFLFVAEQFSRNVSQTLNYSAGTWSGVAIVAVQATSLTRTGLAALRQTAVSANQSAGTPAPAFSVAALTANACVGAVFNGTNPATMTQPSGWNELVDDGHILPATGIEVASIDSGFTGTTVTWGSSSASAFAAMLAEINVQQPPTRYYYEMIGAGARV